MRKLGRCFSLPVLLVVAVVGVAAQEAEKKVWTAADLGWMAGRWVGEMGEVTLEEQWSEPRGESMVGMFRVVKGGVARDYELMAIEQAAGGPVLRLRMFGPGLELEEGRETAMSFPVIKAGPGEVVFEGPDKEGPTRITYKRSGEEMHVRLEKTEQGKPQVADFHFRRAGG